MSDAPRLTHLRDYLRVVRQHRLVIAALTLATAAAAAGLALGETKRYEAAAAMSFGSASQDLELLGSTPVISETVEQRGARSAAVVTRASVAERVKRATASKRSVPELRSMVSTSQQLRTGFVVVTARSTDAREATTLANAFAGAAVEVATEEARARFERAAESLRPRLRRLRRGGDPLSYSLLQQRVATLETLRDVAQPARITQRASVPSAPVSPRPVRSGMLGGLLGLVLGLGFAFVRSSLDVKLRGAAEVAEHLGLPVLGHVSDDAMGFAGLADARQALVSQDRLEVFRILRTNLDFMVPGETTSMVLVTSALPEEGKSTVAASLAAAGAAAGRRTLLVECDLRRPSLAERLGLDPAPGLTDVLLDRVELEDAGHVVPLHVDGLLPSRNGDGAPPPEAGFTLPLDCLLAGTASPLPAELLGSARFRELVALFREHYEFIVLDTSPLLPVVDTMELVQHVDAVLLCVRAHRTTVDQARSARAALERLPARPTGLVLTGTRRGDDKAYGYYSYDYGSPARV